MYNKTATLLATKPAGKTDLLFRRRLSAQEHSTRHNERPSQCDKFRLKKGPTSVNTYARIIWIVLDSVGIGELPDAGDYGDVGRNTLGHIAESRRLHVPNLISLGLANIASLAHLSPEDHLRGAFGKGATRS